MNAQQTNMFPEGEDLPLFSGTPIKGSNEPFKPREAQSQARFSICPTCHDIGRIEANGKMMFCLCEAGQREKARTTLEELPESRRVIQLHELYAGPEDDASRVLRESMKMDPANVRLMNLGASPLTTVELLSVLFGTPKDLTIAARLLVQVQNLCKVQSYAAKELTGLVPGITVDRACRLLAALELAERVRVPRETQPMIKSPADAAHILNDMSSLEQEQMRVILLDTKNKVIHTVTVYQGSVNTTVIRVSELMRAAVRMNATSMVIAHNHPSGDPTPSPEDIAVTREIVNAAKLLDIDCLDHIVIGDAGRFVSLKERGLGFAS